MIYVYYYILLHGYKDTQYFRHGKKNCLIEAFIASHDSLPPFLRNLVAESFDDCLFFVCSSIVLRFENEEQSKNKRR